MDFRLKDWRAKAVLVGWVCFNPCSNGLSAQSIENPIGIISSRMFQSLF